MLGMMENMESIHKAMILMVSGIGKIKLEKLVDYFGSAQTAWSSNHKELKDAGLLGSREIEGILSLRERMDAAETAKHWAQLGIHVCCIEDKEYPKLLRNIFDAPPLLFYRGRILADALCVAVVGSRRSTPYGRNVAHSFSEKLARSGVTIVSGAARGIDTAAHEGALAAGAATVAVLGCGVDIAYPIENSHLLDHIVSEGCIMSEYPPGSPPVPGQFPARNRIVAGLSVGVLVVEAAEKSGALITADCALNENRDVYAVPGSVFSTASRGTHRLIQQGARLVGSAEDILEDLGFSMPEPGMKPQCTLEPTEKRVLRELSYTEPTPVDTMVLRLEMDASQILVILLQLEMAGYVVKDSCVGYSRVAKE